MEKYEALEKILKAYEGYYNIKREDVAEPFTAEASFSLHNEKYFIVKSAKLFESDSNEEVFFKCVDSLTPETFAGLDERAWNEGLGRIDPDLQHKNTDICLIILADHIDDAVVKPIKKTSHNKSFKFGFHGYARYRLIAYDPESGKIVRNRMGEPLEKTIRNIFHF